MSEVQKRQGEIKKEHQQKEMLEGKIKAMESKLLVGGKSIVDHTNEQQRKIEEQRLLLAEEKVGKHSQ